MIRVQWVFFLMGLVAAGVAIVNARDKANPRRWNNGLFWAIYSITFFIGQLLPDVVNEVLVIAMALIAGVGKLGPAPAEQSRGEREASAARWKNKLFIPALAIPFITILGATFIKSGTFGTFTLIDPKDATIIWLGIGTVGALLIGLAMLRPRLSTPMVEARR